LAAAILFAGYKGMASESEIADERSNHDSVVQFDPEVPKYSLSEIQEILRQFKGLSQEFKENLPTLTSTVDSSIQQEEQVPQKCDLEKVKGYVLEFYESTLEGSEQKDSLMAIVEKALEEGIFQQVPNDSFWALNSIFPEDHEDLSQDQLTKLDLSNAGWYGSVNPENKNIVVCYYSENDCFMIIIHEIGHLIELELRKIELDEGSEEVSLYFELKAIEYLLNNEHIQRGGMQLAFIRIADIFLEVEYAKRACCLWKDTLKESESNSEVKRLLSLNDIIHSPEELLKPFTDTIQSNWFKETMKLFILNKNEESDDQYAKMLHCETFTKSIEQKDPEEFTFTLQPKLSLPYVTENFASLYPCMFNYIPLRSAEEVINYFQAPGNSVKWDIENNNRDQCLGVYFLNNSFFVNFVSEHSEKYIEFEKDMQAKGMDIQIIEVNEVFREKLKLTELAANDEKLVFVSSRELPEVKKIFEVTIDNKYAKDLGVAGSLMFRPVDEALKSLSKSQEELKDELGGKLDGITNAFQHLSHYIMQS
ncbi:MAG: hypothetical protein LBS71_02375, partial [Puniceicoccales bacterium]|nr:hypothetical protein [Puniceicoccales bacterium]